MSLDANRPTMVSSEGSFALEQQLITGLIANREASERWARRRREHKELAVNLAAYSNKMKHRIFAPLGPKAMMKAELVHTNEILVSLGVGWFVKVSAQGAADICRRRIEECEEMAKKFEAERVLLESRRNAKMHSEAFGGKEIVEKYDESEEAKWRREHIDKVRRYKRELAQVKGKLAEERPTNTEEDLWKHLDTLELQEELQDELTRLGEDNLSDEEVTTDETDSEDELEVVSTATDQKKRVRFSLNPIAEVHEPPPAKLQQTFAVKEEIQETKPATEAQRAKSSRPTSQFKQSRQNTS